MHWFLNSAGASRCISDFNITVFKNASVYESFHLTENTGQKGLLQGTAVAHHKARRSKARGASPTDTEWQVVDDREWHQRAAMV
jgi:hypothetical protein